MTIRTPNPMSNSQALMDLMRSRERYAKINTQITSGHRIVNVEDDPAGSALILDFQNSISRNSDYMKQVDTASYLLQGTETAVDTVVTNLTRVIELGPTAESSSALGRIATAKEIDAIRSDLLSAANSQQQGKYIFAGSKTTTVPFVDDLTTTPQSVTYNGNGANIDLDVSASASVTTNLPGDSLFFGPGGQGSATDMFAALTALRDALNANDTPGIKAANANLATIFDRVNGTRADLGGRQAGLDALKTGLTDFNAHLESIKFGYESTDYASAAVDLNTETIAQQATLSTLAKVNQKNLFDYMA